jgi:general secretion pathway protein C
MTVDRKKLVLPFAVSTLSGAILGTVALFAINASLLRVPDVAQSLLPRTAALAATAPSDPAERDYHSLMERNLFRAKLQVEIPKPKTEKEIEEEVLTATVRTMALRGVMMGSKKKDTFAVIDLGGQKGVWTYEAGETVDKGLVLKEIRKDSVKLEKGEFGAILKLFSTVYERTPGTIIANPISQQPQKSGVPRAGGSDMEADLKGVKRVGSVTLIPKALAEKLKADNKMVMSSIAVKAADDGLKVVAVDRGSIAEKMGISPDDTLQNINGHRLSAAEDMNKVYESLKNATNFEVKLMRRGKPETLRYEIR